MDLGKKLVLFIFLQCTMAFSEESIDTTSSENEKSPVALTNSHNNRFSLTMGVGRSLGLAGIACYYDFADNWGADVFVGLFRFPIGVTFRHNFFINKYPLVISPNISFFNTGTIYVNEVYFSPGMGLGVDFRTYINRYWFVNSTIGAGYWFDYSDEWFKDLYLNGGLSLGFTFGGENPAHRWLRDEFIPSAGLSALNAAVGFIFSVITPIAILLGQF